MITTSTTVAMQMVLPIPTFRVGPSYSSDLVAAFNVVDLHNHTTNSGIKLTVASLNIDSDLQNSILNFDSVNSTRLINNAAVLSLADDLICLSTVLGDLTYNNESGDKISLTKLTGVDTSSLGAINGDYSGSTANITFTDATDLYSFTSAPSTYALISGGQLDVYSTVTGNVSGYTGKKIEILNSGSQVSSYNLTLPQIPSVTKILSLGVDGVMTPVDTNAMGAVEVSGSVIQLKDGAVTRSMLATNTPTSISIAVSHGANGPEGLKWDNGGTKSISSGWGTSDTYSVHGASYAPDYWLSAAAWTNMYSNPSKTYEYFKISLACTGRPVLVMFSPAMQNNADDTAYGGSGFRITAGPIYIRIYKDETLDGSSKGTGTGGTVLATFKVHSTELDNYSTIPENYMYMALDTPTAATHTYRIQVYAPSYPTDWHINGYQIQAVEL